MSRLKIIIVMLVLPWLATLADAKPVLVVAGNLAYESGTPVDGAFTIRVTNETRTLEVTGEAKLGKYTVTFFASPPETTVAEAGDSLRVEVINPNGETLSSFTHRLSADDISAAVVSLNMVFPNPPPLEPARPLLVVVGNLIDAAGENVDEQFTVRVVNETRNIASTGRSNRGRFRVTLTASQTGGVAASAGDTLRISAINADGVALASVTHQIAVADISAAFVSLDIGVPLRSIPVFAVYGVVTSGDNPVGDGWRVEVVNEERQLTASAITDVFGKYTLSFMEATTVVAGFGDTLALTLENPAGERVGSQLYNLAVADLRAASVSIDINSEWIGTLSRLRIDQPQFDQELRWKGDERRYQLEVNSPGPLIVQIDKVGDFSATLGVKPSPLPDVPANYWSHSGDAALEVTQIHVEPGIYEVRVISDSDDGQYSILATQEVRQARTSLTLNNPIVHAQISIGRGSVSSLVFKPGTNQELIDTSGGRHLLDLGSQDARLGGFFRRDWQIDDLNVQPSSLALNFIHPSGFRNQLSLIWGADGLEVRCELTAPEGLEINGNIAPGAGFRSGSDKWAIPTANGIQMGDFSYPGAETFLHPSPDSTQWAIPTEGWMAFWNEGADEVHGFTFSGGYQLQVANSSTTDLHFKVPAGSSQIAFHVVKPKPATPYEAIRAQFSGPFMTLTPQVDKLFVGVGAELNYTLTYRNTGDADATGVVIEDVLPPELELMGESVSNGGIYDPTTRRISWGIGVVPAFSETRAVTYRAMEQLHVL